MPRFSLRTRIAATLTLLVLLVAGGSTLAVTLTVQRWVYSSAQSVAEARFRTETAEMDNRVVENVSTLLPPSVFDLTFYDSDGDLLNVGSATRADISPSFAAAVAEEPGLHVQRTSTYRVLLGTSISVRSPGGVDGTLQQRDMYVYSVRALPGVRDKIIQIAVVASLTFAVGAMVCIAVGVWFSTVLVKPLSRLDHTARQAADGDLSVRLKTSSVPELAQVIATFNDMMDNHNTSLQRLQRFVADVSHELRTPLAALVPTAEILAEDSHSFPPDSAEAAALMAAEITNLTRLVEDLMEISRHDAHTATLTRTDTDLVALVNSAVISRGWADSVTVDAPNTLVLSIDAPRFEIALTNLIANAIQHGAAPIIVSITESPDTSTISVSDHGIGIPAEEMPRIFDRFYKADTARARSDGSGLGLALAVENIRLHHGSLTAVSQPGLTTFTIKLSTANSPSQPGPP